MKNLRLFLSWMLVAFVVDQSLYWGGRLATAESWPIGLLLVLAGSLLLGPIVTRAALCDEYRRLSRQVDVTTGLMSMRLLRARMHLPNDERVTVEPAFRVHADGNVEMTFLLQGSNDDAVLPEGASIEFGYQDGDEVQAMIRFDPNGPVG